MRLVDLTQPLSARTPRSSDHPEVRFDVLRWYSRHGIQTREIRASLHSGTHVDAPSMYDPAGLTVDALPLESMCGSARVLDVALGPWGVIDAGVLERVGGEVRAGEIVILWTAWSRHYGDEETYVLKAPGLSRSGVDWLVERGVKAVFVDSPSAEHIFMRSRQWRELRPDVFGEADIDPEQFPPAYSHKAFMARGIAIVEGLSEDVEQFCGQRVDVMALPAKYEGVEAAPVRIVAVVEFP